MQSFSGTMHRLQAIGAHVCSANENVNESPNSSSTAREREETVTIRDNRTGDEITGLLFNNILSPIIIILPSPNY